jgi:hypothetical protein
MLSIDNDEEPFLFLNISDKITPDGEITLACVKKFLLPDNLKRAEFGL